MEVRGGYGTVHLDADARTATKRYHCENGNLYLLREAAALAALRCQAVLKLVDVGVECVVTELWDGTLRAAYPKPPSAAQQKRILRGAAQGLAHLHFNGFWHRDVTPVNILVRRAGTRRPRAVLSDFNTCTMYHPRRRHTLCPTADAFAAPEMLLGSREYDQSVDVWSLGVTMWELASGERHFVAEDRSARAALIFAALGEPSDLLCPRVATLPLSEPAARRWAQPCPAAFPPSVATFLRSALQVLPVRRGRAADFAREEPREADWAEPADETWQQTHFLNAAMRSALHEWLAKVAVEVSAERRSFVLSLSLLDRYVAADPALPRGRLQLVGVACLHAAALLFDHCPPSPADLACPGLYDAAAVEECVLLVLRTLRYRCYSRPSFSLELAATALVENWRRCRRSPI